MFGITSQANSGTTTCANFIGLPIISLTEEIDDIYKQIYKNTENSQDTKILPIRSEESFSHNIISQEDILLIENAYKNGGTIRNIKWSIENIIRNKDPLYFVKYLFVEQNCTIINIRTSEEAKYLKQLFPNIVILQVIRLTEHAGIHNGYDVDNKYIDKKILNVSDINTFEIKVKTILNDLRV